MSIKKIAKEAGVSTATVSRVLNNPGYKCSSEELRERIWKIARELNYMPSEAARSLKKGITDTSQKVWYLDVLMTRTGNLETDPCFSELLRVIESEIHRQGCIFFISRCFRMTENAGRKILIRSLRRWSRMGTSAVMD